MEIPDRLQEELRQGRVILFLGAGATIGATGPSGEQPPTQDGLVRALSEEFLGGGFADESLKYVADLAISEASLFDVQDFIADLLEPIQPAEFHTLIPSFKWRGLVTTNYDLVVERAYKSADFSVQGIKSLVKNTDQVDGALRQPDTVPLLKLHGCITITHDEGSPLVLTVDQYVTHRKKRDRLFKTFEGWCYEYTTVFIGHNLRDSDVRHALTVATDLSPSRPRHYLVRPDIPEQESRFWGNRKTTVLEGTFEEFVRSIDASIDRRLRVLSGLQDTDSPIRRRFKHDEKVPEDLAKFLASEVEYLHEGMSIEDGTPERFYRGFDLGWYPIEADLDVVRGRVDDLMFDVVLTDETDRPATVELYVVKAEAGAGKTLLLRRIAWNASFEADRLVVFARDYPELSYGPLYTLHRLTESRIFLFVDNAAENVHQVSRLIDRARDDRLPLTILTAERANAWNSVAADYEPYLTDSYNLYYLNEDEVERLVSKLEENGVEGHLKHLSREERIDAFKRKAGRQLLVALHEATSGKPFEQIILDEYQELRPERAKQLYLSVCALNRLRVPVRAGLISRVYDIPFTQFKEELFEPLELVVKTEEGPAYPVYKARHPRIAQLLFDQVLRDPEDRFREYMTLIGEMNLAYRTDQEAFRRLLKGRDIAELFPDHQMAKQIWDRAEEIAGDDPVFLQQGGIYEMNRANPNFERAEKYLESARELDPRNAVLLHSLAELYRKRAESAESEYMVEKFRKKAESYALRIVDDPQSGKFARHTIIRVKLARLRQLIGDESSTASEINSAVRDIQKQLQTGQQQAPDDSYLRGVEADLHRALQEDERALEALREGFEANPRDSYLARQLARAYKGRGEYEGAVDVLKTALDANPDERQLHFELADTMRESGEYEEDVLRYHYRRGFTPGDTNFLAQFWYARFCYESDERREDALELFETLRNRPMGSKERQRVRDMMLEDGDRRDFVGEITKREPTWGFIRVDRIQSDVFAHQSLTDEDTEWSTLGLGDRVRFHIGFTMRGPVAIDIGRTS